MSSYEDDADRLAEHVPEACDDPYCQICIEDDARRARELEERKPKRRTKQK